MAVTVFNQTGWLAPEITAEGANEGVKGLLVLITDQPGQRGFALAKLLGTAPKNVDRWLKQLKDQVKIEFKVATKAGGYYSIDNKNT